MHARTLGVGEAHNSSRVEQACASAATSRTTALLFLLLLAATGHAEPGGLPDLAGDEAHNMVARLRGATRVAAHHAVRGRPLQFGRRRWPQQPATLRRATLCGPWDPQQAHRAKFEGE